MRASIMSDTINLHKTIDIAKYKVGDDWNDRFKVIYIDDENQFLVIGNTFKNGKPILNTQYMITREGALAEYPHSIS